ncbi:MAG TPA: DUF4012 domain-containing protein [Patescibacteria group bacterium]|nr:DUF4012 domain-containing protein [Patescibacteria group bacterium]
MSRKAPQAANKTSRPLKRSRNSVTPNLEQQLAKVLEQDGVTLSVVSAVYHSAKKKKKESPLRQKDLSLAEASFEDRIRTKDLLLVRHTQESAGLHAVKKVAIRFGPHEPSAYVLSVEQKPSEPECAEADDFASEGESAISSWVAPFEPPPSLEGLLLEARDLSVDEVDPHLFVSQFTPGDALRAYKEQHGLWSRLRAPFIRWEVRVPEKSVQKKSRGFFGSLSSWGKRAFGKAKEEYEEIKEREQELITQTEEAWHVPVMVPKLHVTRVLIGFLGLLIVVSLPAGAVSLSRSFGSSVAQVKSNSELALADMKNAASAKGQEQVAALRQASSRFRAADAALAKVNLLAVAAAQAVPQTRDLYQSAHALLIAGEKATQAGDLLAQGLDRAISATVSHPDERLLTFLTYLDAAVPLLDNAFSQLAAVKTESLPQEVRTQIESLKESLTNGQSSLADFQTIGHLLLSFIGHDRPRTYLFIFQNQTEIRPTGGFMGSIAEVEIDQGEIKKITVPGGGPYDLRGQLMALVAPPKPLQLIDARWEFQDANWFPDFPTSAQKIKWFWSKSGQPTLDGIIAVNESLMPKLLAVTGPIEMPEYGKTITAENFLDEAQKAVELEYDKTENKPKKFIGDLMPKVLERIKQGSHDDWFTYIGLITDALATKDIQVYASSESEETLAERYGWSGTLKPVGGDVLSISEANIAGQKTDGVIQEQVNHDVRIADDGSITDTVTIAREHHGQKGELFRGANNVCYLRVYVPQGSVLLSASGFQPPSADLFKTVPLEHATDTDLAALVSPQENDLIPNVDITNEFGRTAFGGWVQVAPGQTQTTMFTYRLPFTAEALAKQLLPATSNGQSRAAYTLLLTSQSGKTNRQLMTSIHVPEAWKTLWENEGASVSGTQLGFRGAWDRDQVIAGLYDTSYVQTASTHP